VSEQPGGLRGRVLTASQPVVGRLNRLPRPVLPLVMLVLALVGLFVGGLVGFACLTVIALFLLWLQLLGWDRLSMAERLMRFAVILLCAAFAVIQLFPR
jgi:hypothetical protein